MAEKEYIEREEAKKVLAFDYAYAAAKLLDTVPTADVTEIKHGSWEYIATHDCFSCNLCKFDSDVAMDYCGGCGAKMDKE